VGQQAVPVNRDRTGIRDQNNWDNAFVGKDPAGEKRRRNERRPPCKLWQCPVGKPTAARKMLFVCV